MDRWFKTRGWRQWNEGIREREREKGTVFFRQDSSGRSVEGASHTRHLCGNKKRVGDGLPRRVERAPFLSRAPRPRGGATATPNHSASRSIVRVRQSCAEASQPPRLAPIRANKRGFWFFFSLAVSSFFSSIIFRPRETPNQNLSVLYYREPFEGQSIRVAVVPLIKNFSSCR